MILKGNLSWETVLMSYNLPHTIVRNGSFVFNRRVPRAVQAAFGTQVVRVHLGRDKDQARFLADRLTDKLDAIWSAPSVAPVDVSHLLDAVRPRVITLNDAVDSYLLHKRHGRGQNFEKVVRIAQGVMVEACGNRDVESYSREDARAVLRKLQASGVKTATIRPRIDTLKAIFQFTYIEEEIERPNPFARLSIPGEGLDASMSLPN